MGLLKNDKSFLLAPFPQLARGIVAGRAKGRIAFEGLEHGADYLRLTVFRAKN
jgi:hypothetical protein